MRARKSEPPFGDRVARVWGGLDEIMKSADKPDVASAEFFQVTPQQLHAWRAAEGRHRCLAVNARGGRCSNFASPEIDYDPRLWASREPGFCPVHLTSRSACAGPPAAGQQVDDGACATEDDGGATAR